jgi:hypothetical protein
MKALSIILALGVLGTLITSDPAEAWWRRHYGYGYGWGGGYYHPYYGYSRYYYPHPYYSAPALRVGPVVVW